MISVPERVKDALRDGRLLKNYRFNVLETDGTVDFTIDNDTLVYESVKFDERMCSGDTLKFGLCEGSSLEFQYFDHENITGRQLQCFIDVQYKDADGELSEHTIPMGFFTVKKCSRQASTGIQKVTAYNKLMSDYLDANANEEIIAITQEGIVGAPQTTNVGVVLDSLLGEYAIKREAYFVSGTKTMHSYSSVRRFQLCEGTTPQGVYLHVLIRGYDFTPSDYDLANVYRMVMNCKVIYDTTLTYMANVNTYRTKTFREEGAAVYRYMTLNEWFNNGYLTTKGYVETTQQYEGLEINVNNNKTIEELKTEWATNTERFEVLVPLVYAVNSSSYYSFTDEEKGRASTRLYDLFRNYQNWYYEESAQSTLEKTRITLAEAEAFQNVTLRDLQSAIYEQQCQFGQLDRETDLFSGVDLNHTALYPADTLYPANSLYPGGVSETSFKSWYSKLWTDTVGEQSFRNLIITYKGLDANNVPTDFTIEVVVDPDGTTDYIMDDNWLFRNLIWTQADIESYAAAMVTKMQSIKWFPFEMWAAGLPYIETGDMIEIIAGNETHTSYVLQRQLSGIQNLQDTYINGTLDIF